MSTNQELLQFIKETFLSKESYRDDLEIGDFIKEEATGIIFKVIDKDGEDLSSGYYGYAFEDQSNLKIFVAHRGTEISDTDDLSADIQIGLGNMPEEQLADALNFSKNVADENDGIEVADLIQTGHSLGGYIAKIVSVLTGSQAITINAPKIGNSIDNLRNETEFADILEIDIEDYESLIDSLNPNNTKDRITSISAINSQVSDQVSTIGGDSFSTNHIINIDDLGPLSETLNTIDDLVGATKIAVGYKIITYAGVALYDNYTIHRVETTYAQMRADQNNILKDEEIQSLFPYSKDMDFDLELELESGDKKIVNVEIKEGKFYFDGDQTFLDKKNVVSLMSGLMPEVQDVFDNSINKVTLAQSLTVSEIADKYQTTISQIENLNPNISTNSTIISGTNITLRENTQINKVEFANLEYDLQIKEGSNNEFEIVGGRNVIIGKEGAQNTINYQNAAEKIDADLFAQSVLVGTGLAIDGARTNIDITANINNIIGSNFDDRIVGDEGNNVLNGGFGNDELDGDKGGDLLIGGSGVDSYIFNDLATEGKNIIKDVDGTGKLILDGVEVSGVANFIKDENGDRLDNGWILNHNNKDYFLMKVNEYSQKDENGADLLVTMMGDADSSNSLTIKDYNNNKFGIELSKNDSHTFFVSDQGSSGSQKIAYFNNGDFVVSWVWSSGNESGLFFQRFNINGDKIGQQGTVRYYDDDDPRYPATRALDSIAVLSDGGFVIVHTESRSSNVTDIVSLASIYNSNGSKRGEDIEIDFPNSISSFSRVSSIDSGGFRITWEKKLDNHSSGPVEGLMQKFDNGGTKLGSEVLIKSSNYMTNSLGVIEMDDGGFIAVWHEVVQEPLYGVFLQKYNSNNIKVGNKIKINISNGDEQYGPTITALSDGGYIVNGYSRTAGEGNEGFIQRFDNNGIAVGGEILVTQDSSVASIANGGFVVSWAEYNKGVFFQIYDADNNKVGDVENIPGTSRDSLYPQLTSTDSGGFIVTWVENVNPVINSSSFIYEGVSAVFDQNGNPFTDSVQMIDSDQIPVVLDNVIQLASTSLVLASNASDQFNVDSGQTSIEYFIQGFGVNGNDIIDVSSLTNVNQNLNDAVDFEISQNGDDAKILVSSYDVAINLKNYNASNLSSASFIVNDNILNITGDDSDNTLYGNIFDNIIDGKNGDDLLIGGKGDDTYNLSSLGKNTIIDDAYNSKLIIDGQELNAVAKHIKDENDNILENSWVIDHENKQYYLARINGDEEKSAIGENLLITLLGSTDLSNAIIIKNFDFDNWGYGIYKDKAKSEFQVNNYSNSSQRFSEIAPLANGDYIVTWASNLQDGSGYGIFAQRYNSTGDKIDEEFIVNSYIDGNQTSPAISALNDGGYIISWVSIGQDGSSYGVFAQRYDANNAKAGNEFQVNEYVDGNQFQSSITSLINGDFIISWQSSNQDSSGNGIFSQIYDANGVKKGNEFQVNEFIEGHQNTPSLTSLNGGGFLISWSSNLQDGSNAGVFAQRFDTNGQKVGSEFQVNSYSNDNQFLPTSTVLSNGDFVISWTSNAQDGSLFGIFAQKYNASGEKLGEEFQVNSHTDDRQYYQAIEPLNNGGFIIVWQSDLQDGSNYGIFAQIYDANAQKVGSEFQVNEVTDNNQLYPSVASLSNGNIVISWSSDSQDGSEYGVYSKIFDSTGNTIAGQFAYSVIDSSLIPPILDSTTSQPILGDEDDNVINGDESNNVINGNGGDDVINGGLGNDTLTGGVGKDKFVIEQQNTNQEITTTITDFVTNTTNNQEADKIDITKFGNFTDFDDLTITEGSAIVHLGNGQTIHILGITPDDLSADDFSFAENKAPDITKINANSNNSFLYDDTILESLSQNQSALPAIETVDGQAVDVDPIANSLITANKAGEAIVTFKNSVARYNSSVGYYLIDDEGTITNPKLLFKGAHDTAAGTEFFLGNLEAGQKIGFFILADGAGINAWWRTLDKSKWLKYDDIDEAQGTFSFINEADGSLANVYDSATPKLMFTNTATNESYEALGKHTYHSYNNNNLNSDNLLHSGAGWDETKQELLIGFEDSHGTGEVDSDYNDVLFYLKMNNSNGTNNANTNTSSLNNNTNAINSPSLNIQISDANEIKEAVIDITNNIGGDRLVFSNNNFIIDQDSKEVSKVTVDNTDSNNPVTTTTNLGITLTVDETDNSKITISGEQTSEIYQELISSIRFVHVKGDANQTDDINFTRNISISVTDEDDVATSATTSIIIMDKPLTGTNLDNILNGTQFNDLIVAKDGTDTIDAGAGDDSIKGGMGKDFMTGGEGNDTFIFSSLEDSTIQHIDIIEDFTQGEDVLDLSQIESIDELSDLEIIVESGFTKIKDKNSDFQFNLAGDIGVDQDDFWF